MYYQKDANLDQKMTLNLRDNKLMPVIITPWELVLWLSTMKIFNFFFSVICIIETWHYKVTSTKKMFF